MTLIHQPLAVVLLTALSACASRLPPAATATEATPPGISVADNAKPATSLATILRTGILVLFGPEQDAWWGLRQAQGGVIRLQMGPQEFNAYRVWQNQPVEIEGVLLPPFLGSPVMQVIRMHSVPRN